MKSLLEPVEDSSHTTTFKDSNHNIHHRYSSKGIKPKRNIYKHKCRQVLKKKLKKYKLRQDGKEDQDIIDVSNILVSSLFIRSPNKRVDCENELVERQQNYLFRMVRRKQTSITTKTSFIHNNNIKSDKDARQECVTGDEKKQTNAFKLLMDSRNKSIGTNSPGKEKGIDQNDLQDAIDRKNIKAKRNLLLQKMAESKGSAKKKELEEQQEKYINKKMEKRAEKLKSMIINKEPKTVKEKKNDLLDQSRSPLNTIETDKNEVSHKSTKTLQLVNIFNETVMNISPERKHLPKEDEEFLKKLSPSIRKKESMLSYFKKVEKDDSLTVDSENDNVIKVKLGLKKKRVKKKKLSLKRDIVLQDSEENVQVDDIVDIDKIEQTKVVILDQNIITTAKSSKETRKRKREFKSIPDTNGNISTELTDSDGRPKRVSKRPVKYTEEFCLTSSDEELQIFTPKKKKHIKNNKVPNIIEKLNNVEDNTNPSLQINVKENKPQEKKVEKPTPLKPVKLAPIFASKPNPAAIEAKQKFLQSGVPDKLKKITAKKKEDNNLANDFLKVVHIQQLEKNLECPPLKLDDKENCDQEILPIPEDCLFIKLLNKSTSHNIIKLLSNENIDIQAALQNFKKCYPKFPVYRTYKLLRGKKKGDYKDSNIFINMDNSAEVLNCSIDMINDNPDQLTWCDKYKSMSGSEIIGNFETTRELRKWLVAWNENSTKYKTKNSDSSDYYESDPDSRDSIKTNDNLLILSGPTGSGKTSSVYAVAAELHIKVIEVNASSKRTGKIMLQDLQEATQSHIVHRGTGSAENSQKSDEVIDLEPVQVKKRGRPRKVLEHATPKREKIKEKNVVNSQNISQDTRSAMSLILIDDADIVFDQDDGFCSAIMQLVQTSKRPVILITGSLSCPHLQRFLQCSKIMKLHSLSPNMLGTWLDIMCLADSGFCWPGLGAKVLNLYKGDIRKTINSLQFYVCSQDPDLMEGKSQKDSQNVDIPDDECTSMSWADHQDERNIVAHSRLHSNWSWNVCMDENTYCFNKILNVWWSIPKMIYTSDGISNRHQSGNIDRTVNSRSLDSIYNVLESISISDCFSPKRRDEENIASDPWYCSEYDSVSELENLEHYTSNSELRSKISYEIVKGSMNIAQENFGINCNDLDFPDMATRRKRDRTISRHKNLTTYLSPHSTLDRKALALDYWSFCRNICRIEKSKTDTSSRRQNRHCHYLKSLSASCKSDTFDSLANSLNTL